MNIAIIRGGLRACRALVLAIVCGVGAAHAMPFDFHEGNAPAEVIVPRVIPPIYQSVSPGASDATLVLRITTLITNAWFDALAPYDTHAVGVYSNLGRQDPGPTNERKNVAIFYASYRVLNSLLPQHRDDWDAMLMSVGLDPDDDSTDPTTPVGIGNLAGLGVVAARERDGMNQLGDEGGRTHNRIPYADYTGYQPVNTAYVLRDPSRWQPNVVSNGNGLFQVQQFVTPQMRLTRPYAYEHPNAFRVAPPVDSNPRGPQGRHGYKAQADIVLAASAALTDEQKAMAELFDDKLRSLGFSAFFVYHAFGLDLDDFVRYDFLVNMAAFDGAIATWNEKHRFDAVRPFSAIRYLYGNQPVVAWAGPGLGTQSIPASEWRPYMNTADHPEYPSGSACFCSAHAEASRLFLGTDQLGWSVPVPQGSSKVEPGITPSQDIVLHWSTWSEFETDCGQSRLWGGVHFPASIDAAHGLCARFGETAYDFLQRHLSGNP